MNPILLNLCLNLAQIGQIDQNLMKAHTLSAARN